MKPSIYLAADPSRLTLDLPGTTLCVHHRAYTWPQISGATYRRWDEVSERIETYSQGFDNLVMVGLNRIVTPANRTQVMPVLARLPNRKISVDTTLFVGQPWRLMFHAVFFRRPFGDYSYSFLAESHHKAYLDGFREDSPFSLERIVEWGDGFVVSDHPAYWHAINVAVVEMSAETHAAYQAEKVLAFEEEAGPNPVIRRLARFAQDSCPTRSLPDLVRGMYASRTLSVTLTDLAVDRYLWSQQERDVLLINAIAKRFYRRAA